MNARLRDKRAALPSVDRVLRAAETVGLVDRYGRTLATDAAGEIIAEQRGAGKLASVETIVANCAERLAQLMRPSQRRVFNLTGTVLHTNLGPAPLPEEAVAAAVEAMRAPSTLEYDLDNGRRGERDDHIAGWLTRLTGAEAALAVNNNAAGRSICAPYAGRRLRLLQWRGASARFAPAARSALDRAASDAHSCAGSSGSPEDR